MNDTLIKVEGVSKKFCRDLKRSLWYGMQDMGNELLGRRHGGNGELRKDEFWAVKSVSFELKRGECMGLIGHNGAGKTTLLRMLNGLVKPDQGRIEMRGRVGALIALGAGFNPILTGRENIFVNASVLGLGKSEIDAKITEIVDFAEIGEFIDMPVQSYSSGMVVRLGFAVASTLKPDILLLDEVLAVGDANFRSKCWRRIGELLQETAVILVSHESYAISRLCDRAILLDRGTVKCDAPVNDALSVYESAMPPELHVGQRSLHHSVSSIKLIPVSNVVRPGDFYEFNMEINIKSSTCIDHAVINVIDSGEDVHAQSLLNFPLKNLLKGCHHFRVSIGPLYLSKGNFSLMLLISTSGGKVPLIHSRRELSFAFDSHVNYGPKYYPPAKVQRVLG